MHKRTAIALTVSMFSLVYPAYAYHPDQQDSSHRGSGREQSRQESSNTGCQPYRGSDRTYDPNRPRCPIGSGSGNVVRFYPPHPLPDGCKPAECAEISHYVPKGVDAPRGGTQGAGTRS